MLVFSPLSIPRSLLFVLLTPAGVCPEGTSKGLFVAYRLFNCPRRCPVCRTPSPEPRIHFAWERVLLSAVLAAIFAEEAQP